MSVLRIGRRMEKLANIDSSAADVRTTKCDLCDKFCKGVIGLEAHKKDSHLDNKGNEGSHSVYSCCFCKRRFCALFSLLSHIRDSHERKETGSTLASSDFSEHEGNYNFPCSFCRRNFKSVLRLEAHQRDAHLHERSGQSIDSNVIGAVISCPMCQRVFRSHISFQLHQRDYHKVPESPFGLQYAPNIFTDKPISFITVPTPSYCFYSTTMPIHISHAQYIQPAFLCTFCGCGFSSLIGLQVHHNTNHRVIPPVVSLPSSSFPSPSSAGQFKISAPQCVRCGLYFDSPSSLHAHALQPDGCHKVAPSLSSAPPPSSSSSLSSSYSSSSSSSALAPSLPPPSPSPLAPFEKRASIPSSEGNLSENQQSTIVLRNGTQTSRTLRCWHCTKLFKNESSRDTHLMAVHGGGEVCCIMCGKVLGTAGALAQHYHCRHRPGFSPASHFSSASTTPPDMSIS